MRMGSRFLAVLLLPVALAAQSQPDMQQILERLQRLEEQNKALLDEIHALRQEVAAATQRTPEASPQADSHLEERVALSEQKVNDQEQSKVEADHKLPIKL